MRKVKATLFFRTQSTLATARRDWWDAQQGDYANRSSDINKAETAHVGSQGTVITN